MDLRKGELTPGQQIKAQVTKQAGRKTAFYSKLCSKFVRANVKSQGS